MTPQALPFHVAASASRLLPALLAALDGQGWVTAKRLARVLETDDRTIREAASESEGRIISGQRGYCLTQQATVQDVQHAAAWLRSQARKMEYRAYLIEKAVHRRE